MRQLATAARASRGRASGGDFTTASLHVNASTRRIRKLSPGLASEVTRHGKPPPLRDGSSRKWSRDLIHGELQDDVDEVAQWFSNEYDVYSTTVDFFGALGGDDAEFSAVWKSNSETTSRRWRGAPEI